MCRAPKSALGRFPKRQPATWTTGLGHLFECGGVLPFSLCLSLSLSLFLTFLFICMLCPFLFLPAFFLIRCVFPLCLYALLYPSLLLALPLYLSLSSSSLSISLCVPFLLLCFFSLHILLYLFLSLAPTIIIIDRGSSYLALCFC